MFISGINNSEMRRWIMLRSKEAHFHRKSISELPRLVDQEWNRGNCVGQVILDTWEGTGPERYRLENPDGENKKYNCTLVNKIVRLRQNCQRVNFLNSLFAFRPFKQLFQTVWRTELSRNCRSSLSGTGRNKDRYVSFISPESKSVSTSFESHLVQRIDSASPPFPNFVPLDGLPRRSN
jgi:hypothetical protein